MKAALQELLLTSIEEISLTPLQHVYKCVLRMDEKKSANHQKDEGISFELEAWRSRTGIVSRTAMAKKSSASSRPAGLKTMKSPDIRNRQWSEKERQTLRRASRRQREGDDTRIDVQDIPRLNQAQLASMVRLRDVKRK
jgi:hypothetical protein